MKNTGKFFSWDSFTKSTTFLFMNRNSGITRAETSIITSMSSHHFGPQKSGWGRDSITYFVTCLTDFVVRTKGRAP